jgi:hypothetical protein
VVDVGVYTLSLVNGDPSDPGLSRMSSEYVDAGGRGRRGMFRHQDGRDVQGGRARNRTLPQGYGLQVHFGFDDRPSTC